MLLLDEATANLDLATEAKVSAAMAAVAGRRTTILIAHRLQTARTADRIVVLGQGRVLEEGTHDDLVARDGRYAAMWRAFELVSRRRPDRRTDGKTSRRRRTTDPLVRPGRRTTDIRRRLQRTIVDPRSRRGSILRDARPAGAGGRRNRVTPADLTVS